MASGPPAAWQTLVSTHGAALYAANVEPLARFIPAYEALANEAVQLRLQNAELERQLAAAREALASAPSASAAAASNAPAAVTAQLTKLQSKVLELQDSVTAHYKAQADGVRERLALSENNQRLREESRTATSERDRATALARAATAELALVKDALQQREAVLHTLEGELQRTRATLDKKCTEADALRADNDGFVERFMAEQGRNVEEVNAMNALVEAARRERDTALSNLQGAQRRIAELSRSLLAAQQVLTEVQQHQQQQGGVASGLPGGGPGPNPATAPAASVWGPAVPPAPPMAKGSAPASTLPPGGGAAAAAAAGVVGSLPKAGLSSWLRSAAATISAAAATATGAVPGAAGPGGPQTGGGAAGAAAALQVAPPVIADYVFAYSPLPTRAVHTPRPSSAEINAVRFGESSALLCAGSADGCVHVLDTRTGQRAAQLSSSNLGNSVM